MNKSDKLFLHKCKIVIARLTVFKVVTDSVTTLDQG